MRKLILLVGAVALLGLGACGGDDDGDGNGGGGANGSCVALLECSGACGEEDEACALACADENPGGVQAINDMIACTFTSGCGQEDTACLEAACGDEIAACTP